MRRFSGIWRDWIAVYGAVLVSQFLGAFRSFLVADLLGPRQLGLWKSLQLILAYSNWSDLGARQGLNRQLSLLRGRGEHRRAGAARRAVWFLTAVPTALLGAGLFAASVFVKDPWLQRALFSFVPVLLTTRVLFYLIDLANAEQAFGVRSRATLALAVADSVLGPLAAWKGGLLLFLWALSIANLAAIAYLASALRCSWGIAWERAPVVDIVRVGLPIAVSSSFLEGLKSVDRLAILIFLGTEAVGYYALALLVFETAFALPALLGQVLLPHAAGHLAREPRPEVLYENLRRIQLVVGCLLGLASGVAWLVLPWATAIFLPAYAAGVGAARTLLWATVFLATSTTAGAVLIALGETQHLIRIHATTLAVAVVLCSASLAVGLGIGAVAGCMLIAYAVSAFLALRAVGRACGQSARQAGVDFALGHFPIAAVAAGLLAIEWLREGGASGPTVGLAGILFAAVVALAIGRAARSVLLEVTAGQGGAGAEA